MALPSSSDSASHAPLPVWVRHSLAHDRSDDPQIEQTPSGVRPAGEDLRALIEDCLIPDP